MLNIAYLNPFSIFDYTSGSSKSISSIYNVFQKILGVMYIVYAVVSATAKQGI